MLTNRDDIILILGIKKYIEYHFMESLTIDDLCKKAAINSDKFKAGFHQVVGISPHSFIQQLRINEARSLLSTTQKSIKAICLETGYKSKTSFDKTFKKLCGNTPLEYRKQFEK